MSELGNQEKGQSPEALGEATDNFFKKRESALNTALKVIAPSVAGWAVGGVALANENPGLALTSAIIGGITSTGLFTYEMIKGRAQGYQDAEAAKKIQQPTNTPVKS